MSKQQIAFHDAVAMVSERLGIDQQQARAKLIGAMSAGRLRYSGDDERFQSFIKEVEAYRRVEPRKPIKTDLEASLELMAESARQGALTLFALEYHATFERDDVLEWLDAIAEPKLKNAPAPIIREEIAAIYNDPASGQPNIRELPKHVQPRLKARGYKASVRQIQTIGGEPAFRPLRRPVGVRKT
jgi:hypothetical protein